MAFKASNSRVDCFTCSQIRRLIIAVNSSVARVGELKSMVKISIYFSIGASFISAGCTSAPPLSEATGTQQSNIFIKDVVQRIKCEVSDAFNENILRARLPLAFELDGSL